MIQTPDYIAKKTPAALAVSKLFVTRTANRIVVTKTCNVGLSEFLSRQVLKGDDE